MIGHIPSLESDLLTGNAIKVLCNRRFYVSHSLFPTVHASSSPNHSRIHHGDPTGPVISDQHVRTGFFTEPGGPVVSLTTFGKRSEKVHYVLESIARGYIRPSSLILWIDEEVLIRNLPAPIRRLSKRGLEIKSCLNYGPHKKYYPYVQSQEAFSAPLVTADDDILYPRYWLKKLIEANREYPDTVNCYMARVVDVDKGGIRKYAGHKLCSSTRSSFRNLAIGAMGVIYPPSLLMVLKRAGTAFEAYCPRADDIWLHVQALRSGYKVRQIYPRLPYFSFQTVPGSQQTALSCENVTYGDGNDRQVAATYKEDDVQLLRTAQS
jgi:hypothetical protein